MKKIPAIIILFCLVLNLDGQVILPRLVSDGMVLQRSEATRIWGSATPGEKVQVEFLDSAYQCSANDAGYWEVFLYLPEAGGPHTMMIRASNLTEVHNILVGEVWLCSGQSNMELTMERAAPIYAKEIAASENPMIRYFEVPDKYSYKAAQTDLQGGSWISPDPQTIYRISAVSYFFADELWKKYRIPVGIINASMGGSPAECWISEEYLQAFPSHYAELQRFKSDSLIAAIEKAAREKTGTWQSLLRSKDAGFSDPGKPWFSPALKDRKWNRFSLPGYWSDQIPGYKNGAFWLRRNFSVPEEMAGQESLLLLGRIIDSDSVYVNGTFVGTTGYMYPPRRYRIPAGLLKKGQNNVTIRVINSSGKGGFVPDKPYSISNSGGSIDLKGEWKIMQGTAMDPMPGSVTVRWKPGGLYNAMIAPLLNFRIAGVVWYQGESNAERYAEYRELFPAMINCWRKGWNDSLLPFLFVQLPNYMEADPSPAFSSWAFMREAQMSALSLPRTAMAVAIDLGEWNDIHPLNKKDVAHRLGLLAMDMVYGDHELVSSGPVFKNAVFMDDSVQVFFTHAEDGLFTRGNSKPGGFDLAGADGIFHRAEARIEGNTILLSSKDVPHPLAVRYAWANNPDRANLMNSAGLPAWPFRTDSLEK
ncbi:MAG: sialate O-acetylesterase [Bacteroidota bacterium]